VTTIPMNSMFVSPTSVRARCQDTWSVGPPRDPALASRVAKIDLTPPPSHQKALNHRPRGMVQCPVYSTQECPDAHEYPSLTDHLS
jgi:hypothetical protein